MADPTLPKKRAHEGSEEESSSKRQRTESDDGQHAGDAGGGGGIAAQGTRVHQTDGGAPGGGAKEATRAGKAEKSLQDERKSADRLVECSQSENSPGHESTDEAEDSPQDEPERVLPLEDLRAWMDADKASQEELRKHIFRESQADTVSYRSLVEKVYPGYSLAGAKERIRALGDDDSSETFRVMVALHLHQAKLITPEVLENRFCEEDSIPAWAKLAGQLLKEGAKRSSELTGTPKKRALITTLDNTFVDSGVVNDFIAQLEECGKKHRHHPVLAVVQSSGFGKTRLCKEVLLKRGGVMWCLRKDKQENPPQSLLVYELLEKWKGDSQPDKIDQWEREILCWLIVMKNFYAPYEELPYEEQEDVNKAWWNAHAMRKLDVLDVDSQVQKVRGRVWKSTERDMAEEMANLKKWMGKRKMVLFVDEASLLLPCVHFRALREAVGRVKSTLSCFLMMVVCDTLSTIANFAPHDDLRKRTASYRPDDKGSSLTELHTPFCNLPCDLYDACKMPESGGEDLPLLHWKQLVSFGRPMWRSCFEEAENPGTTEWPVTKLRELLLFAEEKLTMGKMDEGKRDENTEKGGYMAVVLARVYCVVNSGPQSVRYVSRHMGTCVGILPNREALVAVTCPEPVLAMAACLEWWNPDKLACALQHMAALHEVRQVSLGERGETAAQVLLAYAYSRSLGDLTQADCEAKYRVSVIEFLRRLGLEAEHGKLLEQSVVYSEGYVALFQFVKLRKKVSKRILKWAARRGCGLVLADGYRGLDFLIPVLTESPEGKWDVGGQLMVQVKNREESSNNYLKSEDLTYKMSPPYVFEELTDTWTVSGKKTVQGATEHPAIETVVCDASPRPKVTVVWLKDQLGEKELSSKGNKRELLERLAKALKIPTTAEQKDDELAKLVWDSCANTAAPIESSSTSGSSTSSSTSGEQYQQQY
eukprot:TRINITY_DN637_c0_g1_i22.p1 TRINITY_DN637_c0_g1~~TRINITY_DN637_c0_g1_i22.p1  ORF type:complete len:984 (+),score=189.06 TRINITY_DN637_c0_g1_i22:156-2954(+)